MKKTFLLSLMIFICLFSFAQSNARLNNFWENTYNINPAAINNQYFSVYSLAVRSQWIRFPGAPKTVYASASAYLDDSRTQLGLKLYEEKIGYTLSSNVALSYAYNIKLNEEWQMNLGLAPTFQNQTYETSDVVTSTKDDRIFQSLTHQNSFNADLGLEIENKNLRIGASSQNIFSLFFSGENNQAYANYFYTMYRKPIDGIVNYGVGLCGIQYRGLSQVEMNFTTYFQSRYQKDIFQAGIFYRSKSEMGTILGINLSDAIHLSYSYDFNISGINRSSIGSHELMIIYKINKCPTCY